MSKKQNVSALNTALARKYPYLVEWHRQSGSYTPYINRLLEAAEDTAAPRDVVYRRTLPGGDPGAWVRLAECNLAVGTFGWAVREAVEKDQEF